MTTLTNEDYTKILQFYNIKIPDSTEKIQQMAEDIIAKKLCRCIKKSSSGFTEPRSIGICTKSIFNKKGFTRGKFTCKGKPKAEFRKTKTTKTKSKKNRK